MALVNRKNLVSLAVQVAETSVPRRAKKRPKRRRRPADPNLLTPKDAASLLGKSERTLEEWRRVGKGPKYSKDGRSIWYRRDRIAEYLADREGQSTEEFKPYVPAGKR